MPQAPGPPGTPQLAHGLSAGMRGDALLLAAPTAKTDNCFSSDSLWHFGQDGLTPDRVRNSNW